ncbi:MAG TPA: hypothetical protein VFE18_19875 [Phenylobacterium sp.]|uniref:hypothetical protein n=1 Tax=Phenylobacterium sp. TaxID=1871053 RepID=UPI002D341CD2|nr:hypothetical protein [Phenylobacterium sp.]HZZ70435.1 hypothetical protein [Phenylobacterium sp.]
MTKAQAALTGEDELARAQSVGAEAPDDPDEGFEVEHEGQVYQLPGALKGGFLRQADYTRKTQELAAHKRALVAAHQAVARQAQAVDQASGERVQLAALDHQLGQFQGVDWRSLAARDPKAAQALWGRCQAMAQARHGLAQSIGHRQAHSRLQAAHQAAARMAQTGRLLQMQIDGWSPEMAAKLVDYARGHGVTLEELRVQDDPRVWKILHCAYQGDLASQRDGMAKTVAKGQAVRPAVVVAGAAATGGGVRDELGTKEWMKRRNELLRKGR